MKKLLAMSVLLLSVLSFSGCVSTCVGGKIDVTPAYRGVSPWCSYGGCAAPYYAPYSCDSYGCY